MRAASPDRPVGVVLRGKQLDIALNALTFMSARMWQDARLRVSPAHQELENTIRAALADVRADIDDASSDDDGYMDMGELAHKLNCTTRHARRVADGLDAHYDGNRKLVPLTAVREHLEGKTA